MDISNQLVVSVNSNGYQIVSLVASHHIWFNVWESDAPSAEVEPMKGSTGGGTELHIAGAGFAYVTQVGARPSLVRWKNSEISPFGFMVDISNYLLWFMKATALSN